MKTLELSELDFLDLLEAEQLFPAKRVARAARNHTMLARELQQPDGSEDVLHLAIDYLADTRAEIDDEVELREVQLLEADLYLCRAENRLVGRALQLAEFDLYEALELFEEAEATDGHCARHAEFLLARLHSGLL